MYYASCVCNIFHSAHDNTLLAQGHLDTWLGGAADRPTFRLPDNPLYLKLGKVKYYIVLNFEDTYVMRMLSNIVLFLLVLIFLGVFYRK